VTWCAAHAEKWHGALKGSEAKAEEWKLVKVQHCAATVVALGRESQDARLNDPLAACHADDVGNGVLRHPSRDQGGSSDD
jgi:hypothetical protein